MFILLKNIYKHILRQLFARVGNIAKTCWENGDSPAIPAIP